MSYEAEAGNFSVALVGDLMMNRRVHGFREPAFTALLDILRSADVGVANLETQINEFELSWAQKPDSISWQVGSPECLDDLKWMGIRAVTTSNNHSYDYNEAGLLATMRHLKARGLPCAGGGKSGLLPLHLLSCNVQLPCAGGGKGRPRPLHLRPMVVCPLGPQIEAIL